MVKRHKSGLYISHCRHSWVEVLVHGGLGLLHEKVYQQIHEVTQEEVQHGLLNIVSEEVFDPIQ